MTSTKTLNYAERIFLSPNVKSILPVGGCDQTKYNVILETNYISSFHWSLQALIGVNRNNANNAKLERT